ncbi:MAG: hypothetical protein JOS17DRAFT_507565 [Linnemannia elongata]|nr:MAG: hypothetical protein JOS17DRAFT_507565 [Linnemannia elongata]
MQLFVLFFLPFPVAFLVYPFCCQDLAYSPHCLSFVISVLSHLKRIIPFSLQEPLSNSLSLSLSLSLLLFLGKQSSNVTKRVSYVRKQHHARTNNIILAQTTSYSHKQHHTRTNGIIKQ